MNILYVIILIICDRRRGGGLKLNFPLEFPYGSMINKAIRKVCQFGYGFVLGLMVSDDWRVWVGCSILWWLGEKPSWRKLFNELSGLEDKESWLFARFMIRGFVWAAPCMLLWPLEHNVALLLSMVAAFPISAYLGYKWFGKWFEDFDEHMITEYSRPAILGVMIILGGML